MIKLSCCIPGGSLMPEGVAGVPDSPARQIVDKCRYLLSLGYDCTECAGGMLADLTDEEAAWLVAENDRESLRLVAVNKGGIDVPVTGGKGVLHAAAGHAPVRGLPRAVADAGDLYAVCKR